MKEIVFAVLSSSVISTLLTLAGGFFIVNKKAADYTNELEKKKKVAEIYYQERAKVLQELYILLVNLPSDVVNLIRFLGKTAQGERWSNPEVYVNLFEELKSNEDKLKKVMLYSSLYLRDDDYKKIKKFREHWGEPIKVIVDLFKLYEKIPDKDSPISTSSNEFKEFSNQTLNVHKLNLMFKDSVDNSKKFGEISDILKRTIASEEIQ